VSLKTKLTISGVLLHSLLLALAIIFREELGLWLIAVEALLLSSLLSYLWLTRKALQPLEYIDVFSSLLKEGEFTFQFSYLGQPELDQLIKQFNLSLKQLHQERLSIGERKHVFEKLMEESPVGVILLDYDRRITECNASAALLLNSVAGKPTEFNVTDTQSSRQIKNIFELDKVAINQQHLITTGEGKRLKIGHYQFRDRGFNRSFYLIQEITRDILKSQKDAYEKLIRLMSHEVNNTIAITNSLLESCLNYQKELSESSRQEFNKAINLVIGRSASLNQFMQGYSEIVKLPKPTPVQFDLSQQLENLAALFHSQCSTHHIKLQTSLTKDVAVFADPHLVEQVLINIIRNAIEAINSNQDQQQKREISLGLQETTTGARLSIVDSGCGISDEIKHHLFTPFFTTKESGQGIGLMLIDEILTLHSFPYKLANNSNSLGAHFRVDFNR